MWTQPENDAFVEELYLAGERVTKGTYKQVGSNRKVVVESEDILPASLDGHVACYIRVHVTWAQVSQCLDTGAGIAMMQTMQSADRR